MTVQIPNVISFDSHAPWRIANPQSGSPEQGLVASE